MGPRDGVVWCGKSRPLPGFNPPTVEPVASRYAGPLIIIMEFFLCGSLCLHIIACVRGFGSWNCALRLQWTTIC